MPVVRYSERQVQTEALPGVRRTAAETEISTGAAKAEGQARAGALGDLGSTITNVGMHYAALAAEERKKANDTQVMASDTALGKWEIQRVYDPVSGALTVKGRDAMGLQDQIAEEFEKVSGEIEAGLTNNEQRAAFAKIKAQRALNLYGNISRHVSGQMQAYQNAEAVAKVENGIDLAIANATDDRRVEEELDLVVKAVKTQARANGWGDDVTKRAVGDALNKAHTGIVENLLDHNDVTRASEHLDEAIKGGVLTDQKQIGRLKNMVEKAGVLEAGLAEADRIIGEGGTVEEQLAKAKTLDRPEVRVAAEQRIEHVEARRVARENQLDHDALEKAYQLVDAGTPVDSLPATVKDRIPTNIPQLREYARRRAKGEPTETDQQTFYDLMMKASTDPAGFASPSFNLMNYRNKLSDADFQQLTQVKANLISGNRKGAQEVLGGFSTKEQILESTLGLYGYDYRAKPDESPETFAVVDEVRRQLDARLAGQPKDKIDNVVIQRELDDLLGRKFGQTKTYFKGLGGFFPGITVQGDQKALLEVQVEDIPAADRQQIEAALRAKGKPITPQLIRHYFIADQLRQQQRR